MPFQVVCCVQHFMCAWSTPKGVGTLISSQVTRLGTVLQICSARAGISTCVHLF